MKIAIPFALLLSSLLNLYASGEEIRWKFVAGERWAMRSEQSTELQIGEEEMDKVSLQQSLTWQTTVEHVSQDGIATVSQELLQAKLTLKTVQGEQIFDSKSASHPPTSPFWDPTKALIGNRIRMRMHPTGETTTIPTENETGRASESIPVSHPTLLGPVDSSSSAPGLGIQFPQEGVSIGKPWTIQSKRELGGEVVFVDSSYQYIGTETVGDVMLDKFKSSTGVRFAKPSEEAQIIKQDMAGTIWFNRQLGKITRLESAQELAIAMPSSRQQKLLQSIELQLIPPNKY